MHDDDWKKATPQDLAKVKAKAEAQQKVIETELEKLQTKALNLWKKDESCARELGETLVAIKKLMEHGEFTKWWTKAGLSQNRVSYCMRLVEGKVEKSKKEAKSSPRAKALVYVTKNLRKLYDLADEGKEPEAKELLEKIIADIKEKFFKKPVAAAASAGS